MLIAEDLLVLLTDPRTGRLRGDLGSVDYGLAAGVLCDLELLGRIRLEASTEGWRRSRVVVDDYAPTGDPVLDAALRVLTPRDRTPTRAVGQVRKKLRRTLQNRLADAGVLTRDSSRLFGMIPVTRYRPASNEAEASVRAEVNRAFVLGASDARTEALVACLAAVGMVGRIVPEVPPMLTKRVIRRRARECLDAVWPARAARTAYLSDSAAASAASG